MDPCIVVWVSRNTNKMQLCNRIYYFQVYWRLNMFRAAHRSSSGALNCICSLWFIYCSKVKDFVYIIPSPHYDSFCGSTTQRGSWPPHFWGFLDHTQRRITVGRTPLDEWSARSRDLYLTTHNIHNRQTSMPTVGFEPTFSAGERPQTYSLDRAAPYYNIVHIIIR